MKTESKITATVRKRYNRIAPVYDLLESLVERSRYSRWRKLLWSKVEGNRILEVGVGTGKNFSYYPAHADITAIDFSERMLSHAMKRSEEQKVKVNLQQMDVQNLEFANNTLDTVVATFAFCSVPDPVKGLMEIKRVCLMNLTNPAVVRIMGPNINRKTVDNVTKSGLKVEQVTDLSAGIFKLIEARKTGSSA